MQLTKNFTLEEMLRSQTATRLNIIKQFIPPQSVIDNLTTLCKKVLQPLRDKIRKAVSVSSGYRSPKVNKAIGGATNNQHLKGQAADISAGGFTPEQLYQHIKNSDLVFDQLIQEFDQWVHVSYNPITKDNRRQCLRAIKQNGKTKYIAG